MTPSFHGNVSVEGDTWEEAVASLVLEDWDECFEAGDGSWNSNSAWSMSRTRTAYIEAEDIHFNCGMIHYQSVHAGDTDRGCLMRHLPCSYELQSTVRAIFKKESN
jgi:hypothetical protein